MSALAVFSQPASSSARLSYVQAGDTYRPSRNWCPTNRTCFAHITWSVYTRTRAVGHGRAKSCAGGGGRCRVTNATVVLDRPRYMCGRFEFSRLRMFGRTFYAGAPPVCATYY